MEQSRWAQAKCKGLADLFIDPEVETHAEKRRRVAEAKKICHTCPLKDQCLDEAFRVKDSKNVWGGMTARDREEYYRKVKTSATLLVEHGTLLGYAWHVYQRRLNRANIPCGACVRAYVLAMTIPTRRGKNE